MYGHGWLKNIPTNLYNGDPERNHYAKATSWSWAPIDLNCEYETI